ncbi:hypothetical protein ACNKHX_20480 [Shigella flexneri]
MIAKSWSYYVYQTSGHCGNRIQAGAGPPPPASRFVKYSRSSNLHAAEVEGDSFSPFTPARKWTWQSAKRATRRHISYFGPEANDFGLLEQTFIEYGRAAKGNLANICIPTTKPSRGDQITGTLAWQPLPEPTPCTVL